MSSAAQNFFFIAESIGKVAGMVSDFVSEAITFDVSITRSGIAMRLTAQETDELRDTIKNLADTSAGGIFSHQATAEAFKAIADEGRGLRGTLDIVRDAMNLAAITGDDLAISADGIESIMSAFNLTVEDSAHITDVLINTFFETGTAVEQQIPTLIQMGQVMTAIGVSFEEAAALIGVLKDKGIGQVQGLLTGFQQMASGTGEASKLMEKFGISVFDSTGKMKPMSQVFRELRTEGASAENMFVAFGQRSAAAMSAVIASLDDVQATAESNFENTGIAAEGAAEFLESDAAATLEFQSAMDDLKLELAEGVLPLLVKLLEILSPLIEFLTENTEVIYGIVAALALWKLALFYYTIAQWAADIALGAFPLTWVIIGIMALILVIVLLVTHWDDVTAAINTASDAIMDKLGPAFEFVGDKLFEFIELVEALFDLVTDMYNWGRDAAEAFGQGIVDGIDAAKNPIENALGGIEAAFTGEAQAFQPVAPSPLGGTGSTTNTTNEGGTTINNNYIVDSDDFIGLIERKITIDAGVSQKAQ